MFKHNNVDIEKGKAIFYEYKGSIFGIERDLGNEYKRCNVPKEIEEQWREDILQSLKTEISNQTGYNRFSAVLDYIYLIDSNEACCFLIDLLNVENLDTFSILLLCETLKDFINKFRENKLSIQILNKVKETIAFNKEKLLCNPIKIDNSYKNLSSLRDYDFSENCVINRINNL